jgi:hypothetical protein
MTNNTTRTLECAAQVNPAASGMLISGSGVTAPSRIRKQDIPALAPRGMA